MASSTTHRYALILGVSSGIGRASALSLARDGFNIIGVHLDRAAGLEAARALQAELQSHGVEAHFFNVNAADADRRAEVIEAIRNIFAGREGAQISFMLHSLAFGSLLPLIPGVEGERTATQKQINMTLDVMANSLVYWTQDVLAAGLFGRGARIVAMSSNGASRVLPTYGIVSAAKAALESYIRQLALELAPHGITANTLRAGVTVTPALEKIPGNQVIQSHAEMRNPHHRLTTPEDVAAMIALLAAEGSYWVNGACIIVDGGEDAVDLTWYGREDLMS